MLFVRKMYVKIVDKKENPVEPGNTELSVNTSKILKKKKMTKIK